MGKFRSVNSSSDSKPGKMLAEIACGFWRSLIWAERTGTETARSVPGGESIKLKLPRDGRAHEQRKAIKTGSGNGSAQARWPGRGERKSAPRLRIQGFQAGIRIHEAGRARGRPNESSPGLVERV